MEYSAENNLKFIEAALSNYLSRKGTLYDILYESMRYSALAGGKRVRPMLTLEFCRLLGGEVKEALPFACAVEFVHTYSLIHDDLPCMDNDDMRRGRASNHIAFSEDIALLAGDALLTLAFEVMLSAENLKSVPAQRVVAAAGVLARMSGADGMVGGQVIDLESEGKETTEETVLTLNSLKTGCLIKAACLMGAIIGGANENQLKAAEEYAECIGQTFQLVDDILDVTSTTESLGKPVNSDIQNEKSTLVSIYGIDECRKRADEYTNRALEALEKIGGDTKALRDFAIKLRDRKN